MIKILFVVVLLHTILSLYFNFILFPILKLPSSELDLLISFEVCGGYTNQRLSIIYGLLLSKEIGSKVNLPQLLYNYNDNRNTSVRFQNFYDEIHFKKELNQYFKFNNNNNTNNNNEDKVYINLNDIVTKAIPIDLLASKVLSSIKSIKNYKEKVIHLSCPLFKFHMNDNKLIKLAWKIDDSLKLNQNIINLALNIKSNLQSYNSNNISTLYGDILLDEDAAMFDGRSSTDINLFNTTNRHISPLIVLHYRSEDDWKAHCLQWLTLVQSKKSNSKSKKNDNTNIIDNCNSNVYNMDDVLLLQNVAVGSFVYVTSDTKPIENSKLYTYVTKTDLLSISSNNNNNNRSKCREYWAAVDFILAHNADIFIGHSISTFSALLLLRRKRKRSVIRFPLYDFCYNENCMNNYNNYNNHKKNKNHKYRNTIIPLELGGLPLSPDDILIADMITNSIAIKRPLDWIFTLYLYENMNLNIIQMMQVAVISARKNTQLNAICMLSYDFNDHFPTDLLSDIIKWLESHQVKVILHQLGGWTKDIQRAFEMNTTIKNLHRSPLYANKNSLIATFMRIDIPFLPLLSSKWILYTDIDVLFLQNIVIDDFELNNNNNNNDDDDDDDVIVIGTERVPGLSYNTNKNNQNKITANVGVMLLNIDRLRETYTSFISTIFNENNVKKGFIFDEGPADQGAIRHYYNKYTIVQQRPSFNIKPYWKPTPISSTLPPLYLSSFTSSSSSPSSFVYFKMNMPIKLGHGAKLIHWHGPKPWEYQQYKLSNGSYCSTKSFCKLLKQCNFNDHDDLCWFWNRLFFHYLSMTS